MKKYNQITIEEREKIFLYLNQGKSFREIGKLLNRSDRTISREVSRNSNNLEYLPSQANQSSIDRRASAKSKKLENPHLKSFVVSKLNRGWSPEQIAGRIKLFAPDKYVSYETIYKFIYSEKYKEFKYWDFLRHGHSKRQNKHHRKVRKSKGLQIPNKTNISQRPAEANQRLKLGHWESDLMEGKKSSPSVVSALVDRKSGFVSLDMLDSKKALPNAQSMIKRLTNLPTKTITFDNGSENHSHEMVAEQTGCKTYFCNPYHSWEKGTVENTIGLVRQYIPKSTDIATVALVDLNTVAWELNNRPRKRLGYFTPYEIMYRKFSASLEV